MANASFTPAQASNSRVFLIEGRARGDHEPQYESCLRMLGLARGFGDIERIECPDPDNYTKFVEVAEIRGATERATTSLEGRYAMDLLSTLLAFANQGCAVDVQLHMGKCTDPSDFNTFEKAVILESAYLTTYGTDDLGTLSSTDNAVVNENADISAKDLYEVRPLGFAIQAATIVTNEVLDVVICDSLSCGDCEVQSDGCKKIFSVTEAAGGSPGTPADIVFTIDKGEAWYAHDVDSLGAAESPDALACVGDYLVVVSNDSGSMHYALLSEFNTIDDPTFTEIATGFVAPNEPNAIWSSGRQAFIVGDNGYVYETTDPVAGVTVVDAGDATTDRLGAVHGLSSTFAVAVGWNGVVIFTENGTSWTPASRPVGIGNHLTCVFVKSETEWWVGTDQGELWYTLDKGVTWTEKTFTGSGAGVVRDIVFATDSIAYLSHDTAAPVGRILRSFDGGYSWKVLPEGVGTLPANDQVNALAVCGDANFVVGVGLSNVAADGYIVLGQAN